MEDEKRTAYEMGGNVLLGLVVLTAAEFAFGVRAGSIVALFIIALVKAGGMRVARNPAGLDRELEGLLRDPAAAREAGRRAREAVAAGRGALGATLALIERNVLEAVKP